MEVAELGDPEARELARQARELHVEHWSQDLPRFEVSDHGDRPRSRDRGARRDAREEATPSLVDGSRREHASRESDEVERAEPEEEVEQRSEPRVAEERRARLQIRIDAPARDEHEDDD